MTGRLSDDNMDQLEAWIDSGPKTFNLLYSITRDGCDPVPFHSKCDDKGPTVTVVYNTQGSVYGGYTSLAWQSPSSYEWKQDDKAFLFQLPHSCQKLCRKFPSQKTNYSIYHNSSYGPSFGGGSDLELFDGKVDPVYGIFSLSKAGGKMVPSSDYEYGGVTAADINNGTMDVVEIEVYSVTDGQRHRRQTAMPWRKYPTMDEKFMGKLREEIVTITPPNREDFAEYRLLLTGPVGSGKSSFINTVYSVFSDRIRQPAITGTSAAGVTKQYTAYRFRAQSGKHLALRLCDMPGQGVTTYDMNYLLDGLVPENYKFHQSNAFSLKSSGSKRRSTPVDEVHAVAVVLDATWVSELSKETRNEIANVIGLCVSKAIPQAVFLTKIDKLDLDLQDDYRNVFKDHTVKRLVEAVSEMFGVPRNNVMPVKNYEQETDLETDVNILALLALRRLQHLAADRMELLTSPKVAAAADSAVEESMMSDTA